jgi:alpha-ribazole phosphatase
MSNPAEPFSAPHSGAKGVVATRWWWVRHAPVREDGGCIYGQKDLGCDTSDRVVFDAVAKILPRDAVWFASSLKRTHQTADAIWAAGFPKPSAMPHVAALAEQHLGEWQGMNRAAFLASRPVGSHWFAPIDEPAPVMMTDLPSRRPMNLSLFACHSSRFPEGATGRLKTRQIPKSDCRHTEFEM